MTTNIKFLYLAVITAFFISCTTSKKASKDAGLDDMGHVTLDSVSVKGMEGDILPKVPPPYKPEEERRWDLLHTKLELSFDWKKENVLGKATLTLSPLFYPQASLQLDAVQFDIHQIKILESPVTSYKNTGEEIIIPLSKIYKPDDKVVVEIEYTAHPSASGINQGAAIMSDKGLFFIDPQDTIPDLPMQIWTQGETTNNSRWFPTIDQPNERCTQEIILTVEDSMLTLSNGLLMSSEPVQGGKRKDYWKLDLPHAPYLTMIAVGQWDKVTDYWRGRPVEYYVDLGYGPSAREIFQHTPEMIEFFSKKLNYDFVWPKYAQVIVRNFVSGAMENTTAVVFGEFIQFHKDEMIEEGTNDYIVSHELFHHWFGDLVTCESWANLTLNEGFANYAEYLWNEYKYGREMADISRLQELSGYFDEAGYNAHPLINYHYDQERDVFDAHSYNKGGLVLHMLRDLVGDDAFFASLRFYLQRNAYQSVELDDLRQAFEEVTGKDLHWFFDQWYFGIGHPRLNVRNTYDVLQKELNIQITQTQDTSGFKEVYALPIEIAIFHQDTTVEYQHIFLDQKDQLFSIPLSMEPIAVVVDPRDILLAEIQHEIPQTEYPLRLVSNLSINHRLSAYRMMDHIEPLVIEKLMQDTSVIIRALVIRYFADQQDAEKLYEISLQDSVLENQYYILQSLIETDPEKAKLLALRMLEKTDKIPVIYSGITAVANVDVDEAINQLSRFSHINSPVIYVLQATTYAKKGTGVTLDFYTSDKAANVKEEYLEEFIAAFALFLSSQTPSIQDQGLAIIDSDFFLRTAYPEYRRFYLITGLLEQYTQEKNPVYQTKILATIKSLYEKETNEYLKEVLKEGLGELLD